MEGNKIYSRLVKDEDDLIGHIAYSVYKRQKIAFKEQCGGNPTDEQLDGFYLSANTDESVELYLQKAEQIFNRTFTNVAITQINEEEDAILRNYKENIKSVLPGFWTSVLQSVLGALVFSVIVALFMMLGVTSESAMRQFIDQFFSNAHP